MKQAVSRKEDANKVMCPNNSEDNKRKYRSMKNKAKKAVSKAIREKADEAFAELKMCPNWMFRMVKGLKTDSMEVVGGRYM